MVHKRKYSERENDPILNSSSENNPTVSSSENVGNTSASMVTKDNPLNISGIENEFHIIEHPIFQASNSTKILINSVIDEFTSFGESLTLKTEIKHIAPTKVACSLVKLLLKYHEHPNLSNISTIFVSHNLELDILSEEEKAFVPESFQTTITNLDSSIVNRPDLLNLLNPVSLGNNMNIIQLMFVCASPSLRFSTRKIILKEILIFYNAMLRNKLVALRDEFETTLRQIASGFKKFLEFSAQMRGLSSNVSDTSVSVKITSENVNSLCNLLGLNHKSSK